MEAHDNTNVCSPEVAQAKLDRLQELMTRVFENELLHGFLLIATVSVPPSGKSTEPDIVAVDGFAGCTLHNLAVLARLLPSRLSQKELAAFLEMLMQTVAAKYPEQAAETKSQLDKLLEMPLPAGKKWMN